MKKIAYLLLAVTLLWSCKSDPKETTETEKTTRESHEGHDHTDHEMDNDDSDRITMTSADITLTESESLPFSEAKLTLVSPTNNQNFPVGKVKFDFDVADYELGSQTDGKNAHCANSAKGQHIHLILNNSPYSAHYEADFEKEMEEGRYVALAFLSRSYHESIKSKDAFKLFNFSVGEDVDQLAFDETASHMFYSRPKGTYKGKDAKHVMLDFYLINTNLSESGNYVQAKVNGEEFKITKWVPYLIEGMPMGENTIELSLMTAEGELVESEFNPVKRTITLDEADAE